MSQISTTRQKEAIQFCSALQSRTKSVQDFFESRNDPSFNDQLSALLCDRLAVRWKGLGTQLARGDPWTDSTLNIFLAGANDITSRLENARRTGGTALDPKNITDMNGLCTARQWLVDVGDPKSDGMGVGVGKQTRWLNDLQPPQLQSRPYSDSAVEQVSFGVVEGEPVTLSFPQEEYRFEATQDGGKTTVTKHDPPPTGFHPTLHRITTTIANTPRTEEGKATAFFHLSCTLE